MYTARPVVTAHLCIVPVLLLFVLLSGQAWAGLRIPPGATFSLGEGEINLSCADLTVDSGARFNGDTGSARVGGFINGGDVRANRSQFEVAGDFSNDGAFDAGQGTVILTDGCGDVATLSGNILFNVLVFSSTTGKTFLIEPGTTRTVTGRLAVRNNPDQPLQLVSTVPGQDAVIQVQGFVDTALAQLLNVEIRSSIPVAARAIPTLSPALMVVLGLVLVWLGRRHIAGPMIG